ncbi:MAG: hypothetical protein NVSMB14_02470 [Isosphaeraceae bacterium]
MNETNGHMNGNGKARVPERFRGILARPDATGLEIEAAMRWAVQEEIADHKCAGDPIAIWEDGRVVMVPAEEIPDLPSER